MKAHSNESMSTLKRMVIWAAIVAAILMIPFVTNAPWTAGDFIFAGVVLFGATLGYELATRNIKNSKSRYIVAAGTLLMVMFIWAMAVVD